MWKYGLCILSIVACLVSSNNLFAQNKLSIDKKYIRSFQKDITTRIYLARRYATIRLPSDIRHHYAKFVPNTTFNVGVGATYKSATLNIGYGIPGINNASSKRGKTNYLDIQAHLYPHRFALDFYGQMYSGFYLRPQAAVPGVSGFYVDENIKFRLLGGAAYYIFNHDKFSFRSILAQDEWQIKSAGSFLAGIELFYGVIRSDTGRIIPIMLPDFTGLSDLNRMRFLNFGPGIGYAYNYVYRKNYFASLSTTVNVTADWVKEQMQNDVFKKGMQLTPNFRYRFSLGYNSRRWAIVGTFTENNIILNSKLTNTNYRFSAGQYRISFVRRFTPNKKTKHLLEPIDNIIEYEF